MTHMISVSIFQRTGSWFTCNFAVLPIYRRMVNKRGDDHKGRLIWKLGKSIHVTARESPLLLGATGCEESLLASLPLHLMAQASVVHRGNSYIPVPGLTSTIETHGYS